MKKIFIFLAILCLLITCNANNYKDIFNGKKTLDENDEMVYIEDGLKLYKSYLKTSATLSRMSIDYPDFLKEQFIFLYEYFWELYQRKTVNSYSLYYLLAFGSYFPYEEEAEIFFDLENKYKYYKKLIESNNWQDEEFCFRLYHINLISEEKFLKVFPNSKYSGLLVMSILNKHLHEVHENQKPNRSISKKHVLKYLTSKQDELDEVKYFTEIINYFEKSNDDSIENTLKLLEYIKSIYNLWGFYIQYIDYFDDPTFFKQLETYCNKKELVFLSDEEGYTIFVQNCENLKCNELYFSSNAGLIIR